MSVRIIIDKRQVHTAIERARRANIAGADFLLRQIVEDFAERLSVTNRTFEDAFFVTPFGKNVAEQLGAIKSVSGIRAHTQSAATEWRADELGLGSKQANLILDIANLHQANDVLGMLIQHRLALREDGLFLSCIPGGDTLFELRQSLLAAEVELSGGAHARVLPFLDVRDAGGLMQRAGFALPVTDVETLVVRYDTMFDLMRDLRAMGATNTLIDRHKRFSNSQRFFSALPSITRIILVIAMAEYEPAFSFIWLSGWSPSDKQHTSLKRSASAQPQT
ncbi:MAG: SAM-dependent methyltransferase [Ahrensia sp.]|nr:SAM-dependent methyltransferase [Ahrensia sp.]